MIVKLTDPDKGLYWDTVLETVEHPLNNTIQRLISQHPSQVLFGVSQKWKVINSLKDKLEELNKDRESKNLEIIRK